MSNHQSGQGPLSALKDAGHSFIMLKASEGATYRDLFMSDWRAEAHSLGLIVGLYHYARGNPTQAEIDNFIGAIADLRSGEFAVLDYEDSRAFGTDAAKAWLQSVESATGNRPLLYSYAPFLAARDTSGLTRWPLWIAAYGPNDGAEHPWPSTDRWAPFQDGGSPPYEGQTPLWQWTSNGSVPGWNGRLDLNRFDGSEADLRALTKGGTTGRVVTYGWREIHSYARSKLGDKAADPTVGQSYGGTHAVGSWHYKDSLAPGPAPPDGCAVDYGNANSDPQAAFDLFRPLCNGPIQELIYQHTIVKYGVESTYSANDHLDHCHIGIAPDAQLPFDPGPVPPEPPRYEEEDPMFTFQLGPDIWVAWFGHRYQLSEVSQLDELRSKGIAFLGQWPSGIQIPIGVATPGAA